MLKLKSALCSAGRGNTRSPRRSVSLVQIQPGKRMALGIILFLFFCGEVAIAAPRSLKEILQSKNLIVGVDVPYGVMEYRDENGALAGIDIDISKAISKALGVDAEFRIIPFKNLFPALQNGSIDLAISAVSITRERQKSLLFSVPYLSSDTMVAVHRSNTSVKNMADMKNRTIGVLRGTIGEKIVKGNDLFSQDKIRVFDSNETRMSQLSSGDLDAILAHFLIKTDLPIRAVGDPVYQNFYGVAAHPGSVELMSRVNATLREMKRNGSLVKIKDEYSE